MHMLANARPPQAQSSLGQGSPGFGTNMIPVIQGRPGGNSASSFHSAPAAGMTATPFMPVMHQGNAAHSDAPHVPSMQSQGMQGARFQGQFAQPFQFAPSVPQFQLQPSHQPHQQQQRTTQPTQFVRSLSNSQTSSSQGGNGFGSLPHSGSSLTQNV